MIVKKLSTNPCTLIAGYGDDISEKKMRCESIKLPQF